MESWGMKVCIVGKYPPIEGGVSASTYWLAYGLAERGHEVCVVTNADEVEPEYRIHLEPGDGASYEPAFPASGGRVEVFQTERLSPRMHHIPRHNPFATKLAGLATHAIRSRGCEVIFTHYFEPYAIATYLASSWTGVPWIVRHAGSDLDRLMRIPELGTAYKEVLRAADGVSTRMTRRFLGFGVRPERLFSAEPHSAPPAFFHPGAPPLEIEDLPKILAPVAADGGPLAFDRALPTIGIYGKVGVSKGSFDLLQALAILRREGLRFNFLALTQGLGFQPFADAIRELGLDDRTWVIPFLPNWRVPSFIRACTAVCFLERDFSIKIHTPMVAYEVFAVGGCLVVSGEIAAKQASREVMADGENVLIVDDPKNHGALAAKLRRVVENPETARRIGAAGTALAKDGGAFDRYIESWEQLLLRLAGRRSAARSYAELAAAPPAGHDQAGAGAETDELAAMPWLEAVLPAQAPALLERFRKSSAAAAAADPLATGLAFCAYLGEQLSADGLAADKGLLEACLRFQTHRWRAQRDDDQARREPPFAAADRLCGAAVSVPRAGSLRPLRSRHAELVEFDYDVTPLFTGPRADTARPAVEKRPTTICFLRAVNLQRTELKLTPAVRELYQMCDGSRSTGTIVDTVAARRGVAPSDLQGQVTAALQRLYDHRVIVFCSEP